jgi:dephospho-CoA kinase
MILGITGGTGCGKTTLLKLIEEQGGMVLDCDVIYHQLLMTDKALLAEIEMAFPGTVTTGVLDRKKLGAVVFADPEALEKLNKITHGAVKKEVLRSLAQKPKLAAIDAIGLFEGGLAPLCQVTVAVTAPKEARVQRLMQRDGITESYARSRIAAQREDAWFWEHCDYALENGGTPQQFHEKCIAFLRQLGIMKENQ